MVFLVVLQADRASSEIRNTNVRLKKTLTQVMFLKVHQGKWKLYLMRLVWLVVLMKFLVLFQLRSSRNFLIDIVLLCIILGIASYLYK